LIVASLKLEIRSLTFSAAVVQLNLEIGPIHL